MLVLTVGSEVRTRKYLPDLPITREVDLVCAERGASNDELLAAAPDASVVVADAISPIDAQLIAAMPNLKLIHSEGVAFNAIDVDAARVVFSPHVGGAAEGMFYRAHRTIWENIARLAAGEELVNRVC